MLWFCIGRVDEESVRVVDVDFSNVDGCVLLDALGQKVDAQWGCGHNGSHDDDLEQCLCDCAEMKSRMALSCWIKVSQRALEGFAVQDCREMMWVKQRASGVSGRLGSAQVEATLWCFVMWDRRTTNI